MGRHLDEFLGDEQRLVRRRPTLEAVRNLVIDASCQQRLWRRAIGGLEERAELDRAARLLPPMPGISCARSRGMPSRIACSTSSAKSRLA